MQRRARPKISGRDRIFSIPGLWERGHVNKFGDLQVGREGLPWLVLICSDNKSEQVGANRNKSGCKAFSPKRGLVFAVNGARRPPPKNSPYTLPPLPSKKPTTPPLPKTRNFIGVGVFQQNEPKMPGAHKIGAAVSGPRITGSKIMGMRFFF